MKGKVAGPHMEREVHLYLPRPVLEQPIPWISSPAGRFGRLSGFTAAVDTAYHDAGMTGARFRAARQEEAFG